MSKKFVARREPGQTIIEVLIATMVVALVLTTIVAGMTLAVRNTANSRYRALAAKMSQEGLESLRQQRDRMGYGSFAEILSTSGNGRYCINTLPETADDLASMQSSACTAGTAVAGVTMKREAVITVGAGSPPSEVAVVVEVSWLDGSVTRVSQVTQVFKDIR